MARWNKRAAHRHAVHAWEDFKELGLKGKRANSISHHLRHAVYRTGRELPRQERVYVERRY